jgi:caa(3)-type oxidase subunit IV
MDTNTNVNYKAEQAGYYKVLIGLLLLTALTLVQPGLFLTDYTFVTQMAIGALKAWMILMYYMHLKGEKLIGAMTLFSLFLVIVFFIIVGIDVANFQYGDVSHITSPAH